MGSGNKPILNKATEANIMMSEPTRPEWILMLFHRPIENMNPRVPHVKRPLLKIIAVVGVLTSGLSGNVGGAV